MSQSLNVSVLGIHMRSQRRRNSSSAQLFAVVDVYDALTTDRPYRKAWSKEQVLTYIHEQSGKHFSPVVVRAFFEMMQE